MPLRAALAVLALWSAPAVSAAPPPRHRTYDPEIALLALTVQKESLPLLQAEMTRQAEWMGLANISVLLEHTFPKARREVSARLNADSDVLEGLRNSFLQFNPSDSPDLDKLVGEIRRYHNMPAGPPLERMKLRRDSTPRALQIEQGVGADIERLLSGTQMLSQPVAYAEKRFGSTGPFLRRRHWNLDFYLGSFRDLSGYYKSLGYRQFYRLHAPYISFAKEAYVLAPEPGLRPRLVYCAFSGREYFDHVRAQWSMLNRTTAAKDPIVQTLSCADCAWTAPGVSGLRELLATVPYRPTAVIMGYETLFQKALAEYSLGVYENAHWRLEMFNTPSGLTATLETLQTSFGDVAGRVLAEFAERGVRRIFYAGPAATVGAVKPNRLYAPQGMAGLDDKDIALQNDFLQQNRSGRHQSVTSPLMVTAEWLDAAQKAGVQTVDCELASIAQRIGKFNASRPDKVALSLAVIGTSLDALHPDEDRSFYTVEYEGQEDKEGAKSAYKNAVLKALLEPPKKLR